MGWQLLGKNRKKILYNFLAFSFLFNSVFGTSLISCADFFSNLRNNISDLREKKNKIARKMREQQKKIQKERSFQKNTKATISDTEKEIEQINFSIEQMQKQIIKNQEKISELEKLKAQKLQEIKKLKKKLKKFLRLMYMGKIPNTYEIILGASNFRNFIDRIQILKYIYQRFISLKNKIIEELDDVKKSINNIEKLKLKIQETKNMLEEQQANLKEKIKVLDELYEKSKQTQERIQCELDRENAELRRIDSEIDNYYRSLLELEKKREKEKKKEKNKKNKDNNKNKAYIPKFSGNKPRLLWPVKNFTDITSGFYDKHERKKAHGATDIGGSGIFGKPVRAPIDMIITSAAYGYNGGYGNLVTAAFQYNSKRYQIYFAHLSRISTSQGLNVSRGSIIGYVGSTGFSTGPHLHFEIRENGIQIDPMSFAYDY